jgi:hypothetical protein
VPGLSLFTYIFKDSRLAITHLPSKFVCILFGMKEIGFLGGLTMILGWGLKGKSESQRTQRKREDTERASANTEIPAAPE